MQIIDYRGAILFSYVLSDWGLGRSPQIQGVEGDILSPCLLIVTTIQFRSFVHLAHQFLVNLSV